MGEHAGDLLRREQAHEPGVDGDGGMLRIAPGGEGVGLIVVDHVDLGHRQAGALGEIAHQAIELRAPASSTSRAPYMDSTMRSEFQ
jgi:hypothetical protein